MLGIIGCLWGCIGCCFITKSIKIDYKGVTNKWNSIYKIKNLNFKN